jgi:hypothetical protein
VVFDPPVRSCSYAGTIGGVPGASLESGTITVFETAQGTDPVQVNTIQPGEQPSDHDFNVQISC